MKALTLWRPWPWAIFHAGARRKLLENRNWPPPDYLVGRGHPLILHAGKTWDEDGAAFIAETLQLAALPPEAQQQGLIGKTLLVGVAKNLAQVPMGQERWWVGDFGWLMHGPATVAFPEPIACSGRQGVWDLGVDLSNKVSDVLIAMDAARKAAGA
jgi:hypothetical protein